LSETTSRRDEVAVFPADDERALEDAVKVLRNGGLVAFPTDTVYGLGADARLPHAVMEIYAAKRRPPDKAVPLLIASLEEIRPYVSSIPEEAFVLMEKLWPGALTLVLPIAQGIPSIISPGPGIAVRMPAHPTPLGLIQRLEAPLAATSANRSGNPDPLTAQEVLAQLGRRIDLLLDGGRTPGALASTVVDLTPRPARILRAGAIPSSRIRELLPDLIE